MLLRTASGALSSARVLLLCLLIQKPRLAQVIAQLRRSRVIDPERRGDFSCRRHVAVGEDREDARVLQGQVHRNRRWRRSVGDRKGALFTISALRRSDARRIAPAMSPRSACRFDGSARRPLQSRKPRSKWTRIGGPEPHRGHGPANVNGGSVATSTGPAQSAAVYAERRRPVNGRHEGATPRVRIPGENRHPVRIGRGFGHRAGGRLRDGAPSPLRSNELAIQRHGRDRDPREGA